MSSAKETVWVPYADLMTALMLVFLFIAIAFMYLIKQQGKEAEKLQEEVKQFIQSRKLIYDDLEHQFEGFKHTWGMEIDRDLTIRFQNPEIIFETDSSTLRKGYKEILRDFFPRYRQVILKYQKMIAEVRIEGHTDTVGRYTYNLKLSQDRARNVLFFIRVLRDYKKNEKLFNFLFSATGIGEARLLDTAGKPVHVSNQAINLDKSRRVEFKIVTASDAFLKKHDNTFQP